MRGRAGGRCRQLGARAQGAAGVRSWRARGRRSVRKAERAAGGARGRLGARQQARWGARQQARRGARQAQAGARGAAGWAACARPVCAAGPGWVFWCT